MTIFISKQLRYFMEAMDKKCISKAAETLCLTRTPLTKKLIDLEGALGEKLFIRTYNELTPTDYANYIYQELRPLYEAHLHFEKTINPKKRKKPTMIIFDISVPEIIYRYIESSLQAEVFPHKIKTQRVIFSGTELSSSVESDNTILIAFRALPLSHNHRHFTLPKIEICILQPKNKQDKKGNIDIYIWNDRYTDYFKGKVRTVLENEYENINFINHNTDLCAIIYKLYHGEGACILPLKIAMMLKNENLEIKKTKTTLISLYFYHIGLSSYDTETIKIKRCLSSLM